MGPVTWKISEYSTRPGYRPSVPGRKRYVRMGPVEVWISADSVSLMIISFSDLVDGNDLLIARTWDAMASTGRSTSCCPCIANFQAGSGRRCGEKRLPTHFISPASFSLRPKAPHTARSTLRLFVRCGLAWDKARPTRQGRAGEKVTFLTLLGIFPCRS